MVLEMRENRDGYPAEDTRYGNKIDVGRQRWKNGLEEQRRTGQILTGNNYQPEGVSSLQ